MPAVTADVVVLRATQRKRLKRLAASTAAPYRLVERARIVLWAAGGATKAAIAARLDVHIDTVRRWRHRFATENIENTDNAENAGYEERPVAVMLDDRPRSGRPRIYGPEDRVRIVATVTEEVPEADSHWSHTLLAEHLHAEVGISPAQIGRILADLDVTPHRVRGWLTRPKDPEFFAKATAVRSLYLQPPQGAVVLSINEKTAIAARSRKHPGRRVRPGHHDRQEVRIHPPRHGVADGRQQDHEIHRGLPPHHETLPLDLRRKPPQSRMIQTPQN
jgi:hypothetical protein